MAQEAERVRQRYNAVLLLVLLALTGYYVAFETSGEGPGEGKKVKRGTPIYLLEPWNVAGLRVEAHDGRELFCERVEGGAWSVRKGKENENLSGIVDDFVGSLLATVEIDKTAVEGQDLCDFGFDSPAFTITLTDVTNKTYQLFLGDSTPGGTCLYARFADAHQILIVGALLDWELKKLDPLMS